MSPGGVESQRDLDVAATKQSQLHEDRIAGIANDEDEKSDTRLRAIKQISDETAANVEGLALEKVDLLLQRGADHRRDRRPSSVSAAETVHR